MPTPSLAQRDKKINLNYPAAGLERPQRAGPAEVDQRHLSALEVDPAAQGRRHAGRAGPAQPVRDQHHRLPRPGLHDDPLGQPGRGARGGSVDRRRPPARRGPCRPRARSATLALGRLPPPATTIPLDQYGMEYNPVAINEVLAYSFLYERRRHGARSGPTGSSSSW